MIAKNPLFWLLLLIDLLITTLAYGLVGLGWAVATFEGIIFLAMLISKLLQLLRDKIMDTDLYRMIHNP